MTRLRNLITGIQALLRKRRIEEQLDEELDAYLDASAAYKERTGLSPEAARRSARVEMGSRNAVKQRVWSSRWESAFDNLFADLRYAIRQLVRTPGFTLVALLSLALGIGANTAIFTLLDAVVLRPLPVEKPNQLYLFGKGLSVGSNDSLPYSSWDLQSNFAYHRFRQQTQAFSSLAAQASIRYGAHGSIGSGAIEKLNINLVSGNYFSTLGIPPALGRVLADGDDQAPGSAPVAVASYGWYQRHFANADAALGQIIHIQGHDYTLIGVTRPGFTGLAPAEPADLFVPICMEKEISPGWNGLDDKLFQSLFLVGRLKDGITLAQATASTNVIFQQMLHNDYLGANPSARNLNDIAHAQIELTSVASGLPGLRFLYSQPLVILMCIVGLVLLIACANIANMLLARGVARTREVAVRQALGASRSRLIVQLLTESLLLSLAGAALGIALAWKASHLLLAMASPGPEPIKLDLTPNLTVLGFTIGITVFTALLFGIFPALRATRIEGAGALTSALKDGRGASSSSTRGALARSLIVGQIALSILLLAASGLFLHSLLNLTSIDTGFDKHNALVFSIDEGTSNIPADARLTQLQQQVEERVQAIPGITAASFSAFTFNEGQDSDAVIIQGAGPADHNHHVLFNEVGTGFLPAMGLQLRSGRNFTAQDTEKSPHVAVINQAMQQRFFPNESPIGRHFGIGEDPAHAGDYEIVGIVKDAKYVRLGEPARMAAYFPYTQRMQYFGNFIVRFRGDKQAATVAVRQAIAQAFPALVINNVSTLSDQVDRSIATPWLIAQVSAFFGLLAVFLAAIGIYGLMSYSVARRTSEIGVRLALGAQTRTVLWLILRESLLLLALGLVIGLPAAIAATRILRQQLYQLDPADPTTFLITAAVISLMTVLAAWLPARRATRVNPLTALRCD